MAAASAIRRVPGRGLFPVRRPAHIEARARWAGRGGGVLWSIGAGVMQARGGGGRRAQELASTIRVVEHAKRHARASVAGRVVAAWLACHSEWGAGQRLGRTATQADAELSRSIGTAWCDGTREGSSNRGSHRRTATPGSLNRCPPQSRRSLLTCTTCCSHTSRSPSWPNTCRRTAGCRTPR